jgi:hypothetical protein
MPKAYARIEHGKREWVATSAERMRNAAKDLTARADKLSKAAYSNPTASSHHAAEVAHRAAKDVHTKLVEKGWETATTRVQRSHHGLMADNHKTFADTL